MEPPGAGWFRVVGMEIKSLAFSTGPWRPKLLCCLFVFSSSMAMVSALLTRIWFMCSPGLPMSLELHTGGMETRLLQAGWPEALRRQSPGTSSWRDWLASEHHSSCRTASTRTGGRKRGSLSQAWCVTNYHPNTMCVLTPVLLLECASLPFACLILSFMVQLKAHLLQDTEISPLLLFFYSFSSYKLQMAYIVYLSVMTGGIGFWPGRGRGDHLGSASFFIEMRHESQIVLHCVYIVCLKLQR